MARIISLFFVLVILSFGLFFGLLNANEVQVNYYLGETALPLSVIIVASLIVGAVLGAIASLGIVFRQKRQLGRLRRKLGRIDEGAPAIQKSA